MAVDYRDETSFSSDSHTMADIAEAIRHKKYGKDVREAIAQGFELIYNELVELKGDSDTAGNADQFKQLQARIDRIVLGQIDQDQIRSVVNEVLKERGM